MKWRSYKKPPKMGVDVLGRDEFYGEFHIVSYRGERCDDGTPRLLPAYAYCDDMFITRWMPLPDPPKGKECGQDGR